MAAEETKDSSAAAAKPSNRVQLSDFIPICSGRMLTNGVPAGDRPKGKAVEIHHHLFDMLWNSGTRKIDATILMAAPDVEGAATSDGDDHNDEEHKGDAQN